MARDVNYNININDDGSMRTLGQLEDLASNLNEEIRGVDRSSEAFGRLTMELQEVERELMGVNSQIEGFTSDKRLEATQGIIDVFAGSIEAASGLAVQLGLNNEEFEKIVTNLLAVQQTANGIRTVAQGYTSLRRALRGVTLAQLQFNAAALANPYVLAAAVIITAIAAVVTQFDEFKRALGDVGVDLPSFSGLFDTFTDGIRAGAAFIAAQLGTITRGFVLLFKGDFSGAFSAFKDALTFDSASSAAVRVFNEPDPEPDEPDTEIIKETTRAIGKCTVEGLNDGLNEGQEDLTDEEGELFNTLFGGATEEENAEIISFNPDDVEVIDEEDEEFDIEQDEAAMKRAEAIDAFEEDLAERKLDREQRLSDGLKTAFADNVEISKAIAIAEGAVAAGRSVKDTVSAVRTITSTANAAANAKDSILPGAGTPDRVRGAVASAIEIGLGAVDLAAIISNTRQTVSALEGGGTYNPTPGGVSQPGFGPTISTPAAAPTSSTLPGNEDGPVEVTMAEGTIEAVVVDGQITNSTERTARRNNQRKLGN